ncbi:type VII secretion protein EccE [Catenuloplanes atrovinosus]|uniref:Type VII secretion protein EccE n=1 Tax=Catenuloplanes atrovinosus TaxID=137266 RepID=A0AAE3YW50_9ACTN|nr:type VII secretion protein EccE [Catenuloplanes atrovinosus]MDR7280958.1 type VII secretion protein EccE [Catenuloplanes atrovinosus]
MTITDTRRRGAPPLPAERRRGRLGGLSVAQLVCVEVAVVAVLASLGGPVWALPVAGVLAVVLLVLAFARRKSRWWFEHRVVSRRFRERARAAAASPDRELAALAPHLSVTEIRERGTPIGVGRDDMGWFVALAVDAGGDTAADAGLGADRIGRILAESALPVSALQVVTHLVPAPTSFLDHAAPAVRSYRELLGGLTIPADSRVWVAARLRPADALAASASRGGGPEGVHRALAALLGRIGKTLDSAGFVSQPLTATELTAAVATVAGLTGAAVTGDAVPAPQAPRENWAGWQGTEAIHVGFLATRLSPSGLSVAARRLPEVGALSATVAVVLNRRPDGDLRMQAIVDVAARATTAAETFAAVTGIFDQCGMQLRRLDGQHAAAIYATAPTGGAIG